MLGEEGKRGWSAAQRMAPAASVLLGLGTQRSRVFMRRGCREAEAVGEGAMGERSREARGLAWGEKIREAGAPWGEGRTRDVGDAVRRETPL